MDHIPYPTHLKVPPIVVPYLGIYKYDGKNFATFDKRLKFKDIEPPVHHHAALAQAWLYFGFLETFIGEGFDRNTFVRKAKSTERGEIEHVVDSSALTGLLHDCVRRQKEKKSPKPKSHQEKIWKNLLPIVRSKISYLEKKSKLDETSTTIFLSIHILLVTLRDFCYPLLPPSLRGYGNYIQSMHKQIIDYFSVLGDGYPDRASPAALMLMQRMKRNGWCAYQIAQYLERTDFVAGYYLSSIPRIEDATHELCSYTRCIAYNTNNKTYVTRHLGDSCECGFDTIDAPYQAVNRIIAKGEIPLIRIRKRKGYRPLLDVVECQPHTEYTAISHVWIDGLGNPKSNGLPQCQIEKLVERLIMLDRIQRSWISRLWIAVTGRSHRTPLVWMDTLCVPVKEEHKHLRKKAINAMSLIYAGAKEVLVLDDELHHIDTKNEPVELLHARAYFSKWNSRSWTLQEGALAQKCYFQFRDKPVQVGFNEQEFSVFQLLWQGLKTPQCVTTKFFWYLVDGIYSRHTEGSQFSACYLQTMTEYVRHSFYILASARFDLRLFSKTIRFINTPPGAAHSNLPNQFERAWNMVGQRTTTYARDLHIILANIAGLAVPQVTALTTPVERTKRILEHIGSFDIGLFYNEYDRPKGGEISYDRWIPSFPGPDQLEGKARAFINSKGMTLSKPKGDGVKVLMLKPGLALPRFWVKNTRHCHDINCRCRVNGPNTKRRTPADMNSGIPNDFINNHLRGSTENPPEDIIQEWFRQWPSNSNVSQIRPQFPWPTNSAGEHVLDEFYYVECLIPPEDDLDRSSYRDHEACVLLCTPVPNGPTDRLRGALLLSTGRKNVGEGKVSMAYDCPIRYAIYSSPRDATIEMLMSTPQVPISREISYEDVIIERGQDTTIRTEPALRDRYFFIQSKFVRRTLFENFTIRIGYTLMFIFVVPLFALIPMAMKGPLGLIGKVWIAVGFLGPPVVWLIIFRVLKRYKRRKVIKVWKETFDEHWALEPEPDVSPFWRVWRRIRGRTGSWRRVEELEGS